MSSQKLLEKVRKLLVLAKHPNTGQAEAENAMEKVNKILLLHNLSIADVNIDQDINSIMESGAITINEVKEEGKWESTLMAILADFNLCQSITFNTRHQREATVSVIGKQENIDVVLYLFDIARSIYRDMSKKQYNHYRKTLLDHYRPDGWTETELLRGKRMAYRTVWIRSYLKGCVSGLFVKLEAQRKKLENDSNQIEQGKFELMVVDNKKEVKEYLDQNFENLGQAKPIKIDSESVAFNLGVTDGRNTELVQGVESNSKKQIA